MSTKEEPEITYVTKPVKITNVNMPFLAMIGFFIKAYFAFLVASVILAVLGGIAWLIFMLVVAIFTRR